MYCQICLEAYNIANRLPKNLSCGHTFCDKCLKKIGIVLSKETVLKLNAQNVAISLEIIYPYATQYMIIFSLKVNLI
jgi:hypothetical protein